MDNPEDAELDEIDLDDFEPEWESGEFCSRCGIWNDHDPRCPVAPEMLNPITDAAFGDLADG